MIIHRKKKGFTVMELMIVMSLTATVLGIVWAMFNISNKIISDVTIKSDLQSEGQVIQEKLSNILMQAIEIESIDGDDQSREINSIKIMSYGSDLNEPTEFTIEKKDLGKTYKDGGKIYELSEGNKIFSNNVKSLTITLIGKNNEKIIQYDEESLKDARSVELSMILKKENGYSKNIEYPVSIKAKLRNIGKN